MASSRGHMEAQPHYDPSGSESKDATSSGSSFGFSTDHNQNGEWDPPRINSDIIKSEDTLAHEEEEQVADEIHEEGGSSRAAQRPMSTSASQSTKGGAFQPKKARFFNNDANEESDDQEEQKDKNDRGNNAERFQASDTGSGSATGTSVRPKRGKSSLTVNIAALRALQRDSERDAPVAIPRKRGRPSLTAPVRTDNPQNAAVSTSSTVNPGGRKRRSDDAEEPPRRSTRVAAESASKQITEQSMKKSKTAVGPATPTMASKAKTRNGPGRKAVTPANSGQKISIPINAKSRGGPAMRRGKPTSASAEYEVELILATRQNKKTKSTEYLVKWKGYHVSDNTWEPAQNLTHCAKALSEFRKGASGK